MSIRYYDLALYEKIKSWCKDDKLVILKPDEVTRLIQIRADQTDDKPISLPLIAISRGNDVELLNTTKQPITYDGLRLEGKSKKKVKQLNAIPIAIHYQIDIYTRHYEEGDEYLRNMLFNLINHPRLLIKIPYNDTDRVHEGNISVDTDVTDNSTTPNKLVSGQFTRWTITLTIADAYLFSVPIRDVWLIKDATIEAKFLKKGDKDAKN